MRRRGRRWPRRWRASCASPGEWSTPSEALRLGVVSEVCADEELMPRALERRRRRSRRSPARRTLETKRRILQDGERTWGELFAEEERVFRAVLLERPRRHRRRNRLRSQLPLRNEDALLGEQRVRRGRGEAVAAAVEHLDRVRAARSSGRPP